jgi:DNA-binding CsgD family transcriptional regulator
VASERPVLLVLEDLHWADSASLELLRHVAAAVPAAGLAVVVTSRPGAADVETVFGLMRRFPATYELQLEPLTVEDVAAYLTESGAALSAADRVHRDSGGLPLLLTAARPGHEAATPYDVRSIALAMLTQAGGAARPVLEGAAVLGDATDRRLLARVADVPDELVRPALEAGARSGLLDGAGHRFAHALLRDGLTAALPPERLLHLHRASGLALAGRGGAAARAAGHLRLAGDDPVVLEARRRVAREAAREAIGSLAYDDAVRFLGDVEDVLAAEGADPAMLAEARLELAGAEYLAGRPLHALAGCRRVSAALADTGQPELVAAAALVVRGLSFPEADEAVTALAETALAEEGQSDRLRSRLLSQIVATEAGAGRPSRVAAMAAEAWELAQQAHDPETYLDAARARESTMTAPEDDVERLRLADLAAAHAVRLGRPVPTVLAQGWRMRAGYALARLDVVHDSLDALTSLSARTGLLLAQWHLARAVAARATLEGCFDVAEAANAEARDLAVRSADSSAAGLSFALQGHIALVRGDAAALPPQQEYAGAPDIPLVHLSRTMGALLNGDRLQAESLYLRLRQVLWRPDADLLFGGVLLRMIDAVEAFGDQEAAVELAARLEPWAATTGVSGIHTVFFERTAAGQFGRALVVAGRTHDAEPLLRRAVELHEAIGAAPYVVMSQLDLADLLASDRPAEAHRLAVTATRHARALDMPGTVARGDALLERLTRHRHDPLSPREREIAALVVEVRSNREIADQLVISERTVETHVRSILAKTGCTNRTELVARRDELGLATT